MIRNFRSVAVRFALVAVCGFCALALQSSAVRAATLSLNPTVDLDVNSAGSVTDNTQLNINGNNSGSNQRRALLNFNLSNPLLVGATINSATLTFNQIELGALDQFGNATLLRVGTQAWTGLTAGATLFSIANDINSTAIASFSLATGPAPGLYPVTVTSTVQGWINNTFNNYGFSVIATEGPFSGVQRQFSSLTGTVAPVLFINYTEFVPVPEPTTGLILGLGMLFVVRKARRRV